MKLKRYESNPVITPADFEEITVGAVFNCGATTLENNNVGLLYRYVPTGYELNKEGTGYLNYVSKIGFAESRDGYDFKLREEPVIYPEYEWDKYGCEDPRITKFKDKGKTRYLITYTALSHPAFSGKGDRVALVETEDFKTFKKKGVIIPGINDKDAFFFPERIKGKIALVHRIPPDIQIAYFDEFGEIFTRDEAFWKEYFNNRKKHNILERKYSWEAVKIGGGASPVKTEEGWLLIYHGVGRDRNYRAGMVLLDLDDPSKEIARSPFPVLEPEKDYEKYGDVNNVVFPEGAVLRDDTLYVYYGGADSVCALATAKLDEILDYLKGVR